jgi:hypothetical protein
LPIIDVEVTIDHAANGPCESARTHREPILGERLRDQLRRVGGAIFTQVTLDRHPHIYRMSRIQGIISIAIDTGIQSAGYRFLHFCRHCRIGKYLISNYMSNLMRQSSARKTRPWREVFGCGRLHAHLPPAIIAKDSPIHINIPTGRYGICTPKLRMLWYECLEVG